VSDTDPAGGRVGRHQARTAGAPGVEFAYDTAMEKQSTQRQGLDQLDVKLGVIAVALSTAAATAIAAGGAAATAAGFLLLIPIYLAGRGFLVRRYRNDPNPITLARYAGDEPSFMKEIALPDALKGFRINQGHIAEKARFLNWSIVSAGLVLVLALASRAFGIR
jgi:hypothetical protein